MAVREIPTPETLRQLLRYEPETGKLFWLPRDRSLFDSSRICNAWNTRHAGSEAGTSDKVGRIRVNVLGDFTLAHRACWAIFYGRWPSGCIDHLNGNASDNRIENLRDCSQAVNAKNIKKQCRNTSGFTGVSWDKGTQKWRADIGHEGKTRYIGVFTSLEEAAMARKLAAKHMGFTDRHGT